jgi:radical SAM superfamily enzyme YgiQ (UPF0313 family)
MNVLLLSMPDSFEHMPALVIRMPNGALSSLAGNVDAHHRVAVADLILAQDRVRETIEQLVRQHTPDVVGLSIMTFQRRTAQKIARLIRRLEPSIKIVVGGYDPSLAPEAYSGPAFDVDFIVRGEGEATFRDLLRALECGQVRLKPDTTGNEEVRLKPDATGNLDCIAGLSYRTCAGMHHNPDRPVSNLQGGAVQPPNRAARVLRGYTMLGRQVDVVETSRGCTYDCSFCSIVELRGRNFHTYAIARVIADIADARACGARAIFLIDDNITLDVGRFAKLCQAIIDARLDRIDYTVQAMTSAIAAHGEALAPLMRRAGVRYVFLGIENIVPQDLVFLRAAAKNAMRREGRTIGNAAVKAVDLLHRHGMFVVGGLIVGNPDDTCESVDANLDFARRYVDWPYIQHPTPYPRTPMAKDFRDRGLIVSEELHEYDGTTAVVRSEHLAAEEAEFMRWRAERWMKLRHMPAAFAHDPLFVATHAWRMLRHTFRGSTLRTWLGLEDEWRAFERYRTIRRAEREYLAVSP